MELGDFAKAIGPGLVSDVIVKSIRSVLNGEIKQVRPGQLVYAIENNLSLWEMTGNNITAIAGNIPPKMIEAGRPMYRKAISDCGNATNLVLSWMKQDNMTLYSIIINTPGGMEWFDRQVRDVCEKLNLDYQV